MSSVSVSPMGNSGASRSHKRQLIRPTNHIPWNVDVVSAVPGTVSEILETALSGATHKKWACLAFPKGIVYVWQNSQTSNLGESIKRPKEYVKCFFPDMIIDENEPSNVAPLLTLSTPHGEDRDTVHLYALHPTTGRLVLRKISRRDLRSKVTLTHTKRALIPMSHSTDGIGNDDENASGGHEEPVHFRSLTCHKSMIVAGNSRGELFWVTLTNVPINLHVQQIEAPDTSGFFSRLLFGSSSGSNRYTSESSLVSAETVVVPLANESEFLALSIKSNIVRWTVEQPIASGHHSNFSAKPLGTFAEKIASAPFDNEWTIQEILKAVVTIDNRFLHCIARGTISGSDESRLYWIVGRLDGEKTDDGSVEAINAMTIVRSHWLSRFALPDQVRVLGLVSCENDSIYAALSVAGDAIIVMALVSGEGDENDHAIHEVDLPMREIPNLLPSMMDRDMVTHGCYIVASTGIGMRVRYMSQEYQHQTPSKRRRLGNDKVLMQHLRSHFWASYQDPNVDKPTPPSLLQADVADLEQAIVQIAAELQQKGVPSSYSISIEWHKYFLKMLQDEGLYRRLSENCKWKLLGIGQELETFGKMAQLLLHDYKHSKEQDMIGSWESCLQPQSMAEWFRLAQKSVEGSGWLHSNLWYAFLMPALDTILGFRQLFSQSVYDVATENSPEPLWINHSSMKEMLKRQIKRWETNYQDVELTLIEAVVKTALLSYHESLSPVQTPDESNMSRMEFVKIQKAGISLLRLLGRDELAFELCVQYRYFDGLCELSVAHEKKRDASFYSLDPLFDTMTGVDSRSGWTFAQHVLQWHTDKGLYGQVINYGRHSIANLNQIMAKNAQLRQYRWIPVVRQGYFGQATAMFLENCKEDKSLRNNEWALSMAKLTNKLIPTQSQEAKEQDLVIERKLELVNAQQKLLNKGEDCPVQSLNELMELTMNKLTESFEQDEKVELAMIALSLCKLMDHGQEKFKIDIWAECILSDYAKWDAWANEGGDLERLRDEALNYTVFGCLLEECRKDDDMKDLKYTKSIEPKVLTKVEGDDNRESFRRVLRAVANPPAEDLIQADSLIVSTFE